MTMRQVFVNPVGVDAAVESPSVRCIAAGFVWNPAFVQLTDPRNVRSCVFYVFIFLHPAPEGEILSLVLKVQLLTDKYPH